MLVPGAGSALKRPLHCLCVCVGGVESFQPCPGHLCVGGKMQTLSLGSSPGPGSPIHFCQWKNSRHLSVQMKRMNLYFPRDGNRATELSDLIVPAAEKNYAHVE